MSNYYLSNSTNTLNDIFDASNTSGSTNTRFYQNGSPILYTPSTFTGNIGSAGSNTTGYYSNNIDLYNIYSSKYQVFLNTEQNSIMESLNSGSTTYVSRYTSWQNESGINKAPTESSVPTTSYTHLLPSYCKSFSALLFGGGGGGGPGSGQPGGGGGGGGFSVGYWTVVSGQTTVSITAGSGGLGGYNIGGITNGQVGTNTTVTYNGRTVTAYGGAGGVYNASSSASGGSSSNTTIKSVSYNGTAGNSGYYYGQSGNPSPSNQNYGGTVGYPSSSSQYPTTSNMSTLINYTFIPSSLIPLIGIGSGGIGSDQSITYSTGLGLPGMAVLFFYY